MPSFQFATFVTFAPRYFTCIFTSGLSSSPCNSFFILFINSIFLNIFQFPYFTLKLFCIHYTLLFICLHQFFYLLNEFSFIFWECPFLFVLLDPVLVSFKSPVFRLLINLPKHISRLTCFVLSSLHRISACASFLSTCICCCSFFTCHSCLICHPDLAYLLGFLKGIPILLQFTFTLV